MKKNTLIAIRPTPDSVIAAMMLRGFYKNSKILEIPEDTDKNLFKIMSELKPERLIGLNLHLSLESMKTLNDTRNNGLDLSVFDTLMNSIYSYVEFKWVLYADNICIPIYESIKDLVFVENFKPYIDIMNNPLDKKYQDLEIVLEILGVNGLIGYMTEEEGYRDLSTLIQNRHHELMYRLYHQVLEFNNPVIKAKMKSYDLGHTGLCYSLFTEEHIQLVNNRYTIIRRDKEDKLLEHFKDKEIHVGKYYIFIRRK